MQAVYSEGVRDLSDAEKRNLEKVLITKTERCSQLVTVPDYFSSALMC